VIFAETERFDWVDAEAFRANRLDCLLFALSVLAVLAVFLWLCRGRKRSSLVAQYSCRFAWCFLCCFPLAMWLGYLEEITPYGHSYHPSFHDVRWDRLSYRVSLSFNFSCVLAALLMPTPERTAPPEGRKRATVLPSLTPRPTIPDVGPRWPHVRNLCS
jgi:hypothetical protein